jgi:hypothetical protein
MKVPVRLNQMWVMEFIAMIESSYDLTAEENQDAVELLAYLKKRLGAFA